MTSGSKEAAGGKGICIQIITEAPKTAEQYSRKYCHTAMHEKNYPIRECFHTTSEKVAKIERGDEETLEELCERARQLGLAGVVRIRLNPGSPGRRKLFESECDYLARSKGKRPRDIAILRIGAEESRA